MSLHALPPALQDAPRRNILGTPVAAIARDEAMMLLQARIDDRHFTKVTFLNAHNANVAQTNAAFAAILQDFLVLPDGIGVDMAAKLLYGAPFPANLNGTDFVPAFLRHVEKPLKVALIGASRENAEAAQKRLEHLAPQHDFTLVHDGFFSAEDEPGILKTLAGIRPDILLVAMGVPRQEIWVAENIRAEHCTVPVAVGALFDFLSGAVPRAPSWMRKARLEWLCRLYLEPARLWRRYVLGNPVFLLRVLRQRLSRSGEG